MAGRNDSPVTLGRLLDGLAALPPALDREIGGIAMDSRRVRPGDLFLACVGVSGHGAAYVPQAVAAGAAAVVWEATPGMAAPGAGEVPVIAVPSRPGLAGEIAARFHRHPSHALRVLGVTGTNGKTSCSHYLAQCLEAAGHRCGIVGTLGNGRCGQLRPATHTTPDAVTLQGLLAGMREEGMDHVVMEVSSHALDQGRVAAVRFEAALFTNLSHDHLDYHGDLDRYGRCKQRLFQAPGLRHAAFNADDPEGRRLLAELAPDLSAVAYGLGEAVTRCGAGRWVRGEILRQDGSGLWLAVHGSWGEGELRSGLLGRFNAVNLLGVLALLLALDMPLDDALRHLSAVRPVPGRMERFGGGDAPLVVVDYAHTPAALEAVLQTLRGLTGGRLWCVFGCGGDRDREKRPAMGAVAERWADRVVVTDDNPRREDPRRIVEDILRGMRRPDAVEVIQDRAAAIAHALDAASSDDVVLVAGKGHEEYQQVGDRRLAFSDRRQVATRLGEAA